MAFKIGRATDIQQDIDGSITITVQDTKGRKWFYFDCESPDYILVGDLGKIVKHSPLLIFPAMITTTVERRENEYTA